MKQQELLGIDVGGSGIKGAIIDLETGELRSERFRVATPSPAKPALVAVAFKEVVEQFKWKGPIGCGFPAVIREGVALTAANIDPQWIGTNAAQLLGKATGCEVYISNDADLAGLAEMRYGVGRGKNGTVILITIGSGLGSALFINGRMVPNTELGHLFLKNSKQIAERYAADSARKREDLSWEEWGTRFNKYLQHLERLFSPSLFILGGGGSKKFDRYREVLTLKTEVIPAQMRNNAGIIGAAIFAAESQGLEV
ncbi:MAG: ROK family protein [Bacteroidota bacterium]